LPIFCSPEPNITITGRPLSSVLHFYILNHWTQGRLKPIGPIAPDLPRNYVRLFKNTQQYTAGLKEKSNWVQNILRPALIGPIGMALGRKVHTNLCWFLFGNQQQEKEAPSCLNGVYR